MVVTFAAVYMVFIKENHALQFHLQPKKTQYIKYCMKKT